MALLLGEDGRGYDLARRLEGGGAWRAWLGDAAYAAFAHALASPSAWEAFMTSKTQVHLQLRARALLYDKASAFLSVRPPSSSSSAGPSLSDINPTYLQLHGDDIYFSLEDLQDGVHHQTHSRPEVSPCKAKEYSYERTSCVGLRFNEPENINTSQRHRHDELQDSWYSKCAEKYRIRHHKAPYCDKESSKRTSEGMSAFLKLNEVHKRKRQAFKEEHILGNVTSMHSRFISDVNNSTEEDNLFLPETMFPSNCVPDSALPATNGHEENQKVEVFGVLDNFPSVISTSPAMIERFGIKPEYVKVETKCRGKYGSGGNRTSLSQQQVTQMTHKVAARSLASIGFEGSTEVPMEVLSECIGNHISKLGRILKLLTDSFRKQFSSIEVLKMFLQTAGYSNLGALAEITKDVNKGFTQQSQQHVRVLQSPHHNPLLQNQQIQRQMHPQMNMLHPQNLTFQQQQEKLRRRQVSIPRGSVMVMDKDHQPMVEVKIENMVDTPVDGTFGALNKHQLQMRHQPMAMASQQHPQSSQQFKQLPPIQIPQFQAQSAYGMRTPPVKVEAFHELVGGDSTLKHDPEPNKLTSPSK